MREHQQRERLHYLEIAAEMERCKAAIKVLAGHLESTRDTGRLASRAAAHRAIMDLKVRLHPWKSSGVMQ